VNRDGRYYRCELCQCPGLWAIRVATVMHKRVDYMGERVDAVEELVKLYQIGLDLLGNTLQMVSSLTKFIMVCLLNLFAELGNVSQIGIVIAWGEEVMEHTAIRIL
jgi:hypothetical protein